MNIRILFIALFLLMSHRSFAKDDGVAVDVGFGLPSIKLTNYDNTEAHFSGYSFTARGLFPFYSAGSLNAIATVPIEFSSLENNANSGSQTETGQHLNYGLGIELQLNAIRLGYDFQFTSADHYWTGAHNDHISFDYQKHGWYIGLNFELSKSIESSVLYSSSSSSFKDDNINAGLDTDFSQTTIWFILKVGTGKKTGNLFGDIVN